ncbi:MAG: hypothetical protein M1832_001533 [Thelocarpon impressellum]|nr:MAG: hypothetical protein M1832_001533 [Thelocarpon impressellum]
MIRSHVAIALSASALALVLLWQLISTFGLPHVEFLNPSFFYAVDAVDSQVPFVKEGSQTGISVHGDLYLLGTGKADITGPVVEINMMGYADPDQVGTGLRQRIYSRAFIVGNVDEPDDRFVYLVLDTQSGDTAVRYGVLQGLANLGPEYAVYKQSNVALTGTHSHSGPGAWLNYLLPQITSKGFDKQSYQAIVDGVILSIQRAHESLSPGFLTFGTTNIAGANVNRSPYAYLANPREELQRYKDDVDKDLTLLRFQRAEDHKNIGVLTWFPVHGTSMLGNNTLVTGDNKGVAAWLFEKSVSGAEDTSDGFVAGFSQSNVGDTSPNVLGAFCEDGSNVECDFQDSTCGGKTQSCHGRGPYFGRNDGGARSCFEIGKRQFEGAKQLYDSLDNAGTRVRGPAVKSLHTFKNFSNFTFSLPNGTIATTCPAALGYSFAAGTTDGPGAFDFKQNNSGAPNANPLWSAVSGFLREPSAEQKRCHDSKPILLDVGEIANPYLWTPNIVDIQLLRVGQLFVIVSPGEATTMAGRRWKEAIGERADALRLSEDDSIVVLGGPANSYTHYIATEEEYSIQRYEGASTLYGPHTLNAYINATLDNIHYLSARSKRGPAAGPLPPNYVNSSLSFINGVVYDRTPLFKSFGDVIAEDNDRVAYTFVGANPRNNLRLEGTYAAVELKREDGSWEKARDDGDWSLTFSWKRTSEALGTSEVTIHWDVEEDAEGGTYRIHYYGDSKAPFSGTITPFEGISPDFEISRGIRT